MRNWRSGSVVDRFPKMYDLTLTWFLAAPTFWNWESTLASGVVDAVRYDPLCRWKDQGSESLVSLPRSSEQSNWAGQSLISGLMNSRVGASSWSPPPNPASATWLTIARVPKDTELRGKGQTDNRQAKEPTGASEIA